MVILYTSFLSGESNRQQWAMLATGSKRKEWKKRTVLFYLVLGGHFISYHVYMNWESIAAASY